MKKPGASPSPAGPKLRRFFSAGEIDLARVLNRQDPASDTLRRRPAGQRLHDPFHRNVGRRQKAMNRHLARARLTDLPQHQRSRRRHPLNQPICSLRDPDISIRHATVSRETSGYFELYSASSWNCLITSVNAVAPGGGEGRGEVGDSRCRQRDPPHLPAASRRAPPSPPIRAEREPVARSTNPCLGGARTGRPVAQRALPG